MSSFESDSEDEYTTNDAISYFPITDAQYPCTSLLSSLQHDRDRGFDLLEFLPDPRLDDFFESTIILINKARSYMLKYNKFDSNVLDGLKMFLKTKEPDEEIYFQPTLPDDSYLIYIDDLEDFLNQHERIAESEIKQSSVPSTDDEDHKKIIEMLQMQIQSLNQQLEKSKDIMASMIQLSDDSPHDKDSLKQDNDTYYFSSYSHSSIHETMLQDRIRTEAYQNAIINNPHMFKDKVVMDIGCGTSILSLFAAKAGAKKVIAIDASDVYKEAREIVELNGYSHIITVVHGKVEDLIASKQLPLQEGEKVDVVISEWMGYALFFETMLPSVMKVRDLLMDRKEGTMWPNQCNFFIEGASDKRLDYWDNVYGMNMIPMKTRVIHELRKEATVEIVNDESIVTDRFEAAAWDLNQCEDKHLDFEVPFELKPRTGSVCTVDRLVLSFDIDFKSSNSNPVSFSTGCQSEPTHWKQTTLWFDPNDSMPTLESGKVLRGTFYMGRNQINQRDMDFIVQWEVGYKCGDVFEKENGGVIKSKLSA